MPSRTRFLCGLGAAVVGCCGLAYLFGQLFVPHHLGVEAAVSPEGDKLLVTLVNHSSRPARIIGNQGACGESGGCILAMNIPQLAELPSVVPGEEETFTFAVQRAPSEFLSCATLIRVDDGGRLREFTIRIQGQPGDLHASVEEQLLVPSVP